MAKAVCEKGDVWHGLPDGSIGVCDSRFASQIVLWNKHRRKFSPLAQLSRRRVYRPQHRRIEIYNETSSVFSVKLTSPSGRVTLVKHIPNEMLNAVKALRSRHEQVCSDSLKRDYPSALALRKFSNLHPRNTSSLYVECTENTASPVKECPPKTFFNGSDCVSVLTCDAVGAGEKWADSSRTGGYFECIDGAAKSMTCPEGTVFSGVTCVALENDGCFGMANGTKVPASNNAYYVCEGGKAIGPPHLCPAAAPLFRKGVCISPLCAEASQSSPKNVTFHEESKYQVEAERTKEQHSTKASVVHFECVDGVPLVQAPKSRSYKGNVSLVGYRAYLEWCVSEKAVNCIKNGLVPMHWVPLWPPWVPENDRFEEALAKNENMITLWRLNGNMETSPFSYAILSHKAGVWSFTQSNSRQLVFRVHSTRTTVPFRPCEVVSLGDAVGWAVSTHPGLKYTFGNYSGRVLFLGDENVAVRVADGALQLLLRAANDSIIIDEKNPRAVRLSTEIELSPSSIACPGRAWSAYFPVLPRWKGPRERATQSRRDFVAVVNSGASVAYAITAAKGSGDIFRTVKRRKHGFRTYAYTSTQRHMVSSSRVIEFSRRNDRIEHNDEKGMYNFVGSVIRDSRCRNSFSFLGIRFASFTTPTEAFLCDEFGAVTHSVTHVATNSKLPFPFAPQEFSLKGDESVLRCKEYNTAVRVSPSLERLYAFGFVDTTRFELPNGYFLPFSFSEATLIPKNKMFALPHLPLRLYRNSSDEIFLAVLEDMSSDASRQSRLDCAEAGKIWDFDSDSCTDFRSNTLLTEDLSGTLFV